MGQAEARAAAAALSGLHLVMLRRFWLISVGSFCCSLATIDTTERKGSQLVPQDTFIFTCVRANDLRRIF